VTDARHWDELDDDAQGAKTSIGRSEPVLTTRGNSASQTGEGDSPLTDPSYPELQPTQKSRRTLLVVLLILSLLLTAAGLLVLFDIVHVPI
jgi:hypothetical protein